MESHFRCKRSGLIDFGSSTENEELRAGVQQFIQQHTPPELLQKLKDIRDGQTGPLVREFRRNVAEKGRLAMSWPRGSHIDQCIVEEEFVRANIGVGLSATFAQGGAIMAVGTEE